VRRMVAKGQVTGYRIGPRLIRFDLEELDALMRPIPATKAS
jgi:excisionase family DNA binding protein